MADNKKGFKLYADQKVFIDQLPNELAGKVFKHLFAYVNDENPDEDDLLLKLAFAPIKRQLKHDLKLYESIVKRNQENGIKGGRPKKPNGLIGLNNKPKKADKDKDKDILIKTSKKVFNRLLEIKTEFPFSELWEKYDRMDERKEDYCLNTWNNFEEKQRADAMAFLPMYLIMHKKPQHRMNLDNFLIDKFWETKDSKYSRDGFIESIKDKTDPGFKMLTRNEKIKWIKANIKF